MTEQLSFEDAKFNALEIINDIYMDKLLEKLPKNLFDKHKEVLLSVIKHNINPICIEVIEKNTDKLKEKFEKISQYDRITNEEIQEKFNSEINALLTFWSKMKLEAKTVIIVKDIMSLIKFKEGNFNKNYKKREKEEKTFEQLKTKYKV